MCGEKYVLARRGPLALGSPPRVRGKAPAFTAACVLRGITPACAGKSLYALDGLPEHEDHPRVCGEKACLAPRSLAG